MQLKRKFNELLPLTPEGLRNPTQATKKQLSGRLLRYDNTLEGVPYRLKRVKRESDHGRVDEIDDFIFFPVSYTLHYLKFDAAQSVVGTVQATFPTHISLLVHGIFQAVLAKEDLSDKVIALEEDEWAYVKSGERIAIGDRFQFQVLRVEVHEQGQFSIVGEAKRIKQSGKWEDLKDQSQVIEDQQLLQKLQIAQQALAPI